MTVRFAIVFAAVICGLVSLSVPTLARASEQRADSLTQTALTLDARPEVGKTQFLQRCSNCHGRNGEGDDARLIPALAGQRFAYLVRQLADFAAAEREGIPMYHAAAQTRLRDPQSWSNVAAYLNQLQAPQGTRTGSGATAALGRGIFHEQCASCHRADASGDQEGFVPSLRHQHYDYLLAQLHGMAQGHRHNVDQNLVLFIRSLDEVDIVAVADYLSRLRGQAHVHNRMLGNGVVVN
jgi:cytochrome c553